MLTQAAEFDIKGYVAKIATVGATRKVRISSRIEWKDSDGHWQNKTRWNTVTVFQDPVIKWIDNELQPGDFVECSGSFEETEYDRGGERVYDTLINSKKLTRVLSKEQLDLLRDARNDADSET